MSASCHRRALLVTHPGFLEYDFGDDHPLRPERITAGLDLLQRSALWNNDDESLVPFPASREDLIRVHSPELIRAVEEAGSGWMPAVELARYGLRSLDNPPFPGMHHAASLVAGGGAAAIRAVMDGTVSHVFHPAGGLHHASRSCVSGFCVYNDPALAAAIASGEYGARVLYVDFDCHHGDGVQSIFYERPDVLTISFHETGKYLFPGTGDVRECGKGAGYGYSINVPLQPFTQDESWCEAIDRVLPESIERFRPDVLLSAHGADTHIWDPLTHLALTTRSLAHQAALTHTLAHAHCGGRWVAFGSGGYDWRRVVPRSWAVVWAEMSGRGLPVTLPDAWLETWRDNLDPFPTVFSDPQELRVPMPRREEISRSNQRSVADARRVVEGLAVKPFQQ